MTLLREIKTLLVSALLLLAMPMAAENRLYIGDSEVVAGKTVTLAINLQSEMPVCGFQCNVTLPEGISVMMDEMGECVFDHGSRTNYKRHTLHCVLQSDGTLSFLGYSASVLPYLELDGDIATFDVKAISDLASGEYQIRLTDIVISTPDDQTITLPDYVAKLTVKDDLACILSPDIETQVSRSTYMLNGVKVNGRIAPGIYIVGKKKTIKG